ncbi:gonadotropin-releasing hormone receptor isoform X3 [Zootermopsis nevadensis]|nr:gonadotropin-releasing hormone receptor isoform X3 [Zootermopsis nevadensis]XP_021931108.1 gonadotropin-releasing hormone receptor isoform X3 [Zootermopsis nevadensis]
MSDVGMITALPAEECQRIISLNASLWTLLTVYANSSGEFKCLRHAPEFTNKIAVKTAVLTVMAVLSFVGNTWTIASIRKNRSAKRSHQSWSAVYTLILHLSIVDLLVTLFCLAGEAAWSYTVAWVAGNAECKIFKFLQMSSLYLSTFVLVLIGVDRFVVVKYPMKSLNTARRLNRLIIFVWVLSLTLSIPQLVIFHVEKGPFYEDFYQCVTFGFYTEPWQEQLYTTFSLVCMFILPLLIIISTYVSTIITISKSEKMFKAEVETGGKHVASEVNRRRIIHRAKMKSLRISVVIVVAFIVCWAPYYIMMIIFMFLNPDEHLGEDLRNGIFFFGMSNSLINPLIYGAFHLWKPKKSKQNDSVSHYRDGSMAGRSIANNTSVIEDRGGSRRVVMNRGSTRSSVTLRQGDVNDEKTTVVLLEQVMPDGNNHGLQRNRSSRRLANKFLLHYKGVLGGGANMQTHI